MTNATQKIEKTCPAVELQNTEKLVENKASIAVSSSKLTKEPNFPILFLKLLIKSSPFIKLGLLKYMQENPLY